MISTQFLFICLAHYDIARRLYTPSKAYRYFLVPIFAVALRPTGYGQQKKQDLLHTACQYLHSPNSQDMIFKQEQINKTDHWPLKTNP
jgi:hypothetical protein